MTQHTAGQDGRETVAVSLAATRRRVLMLPNYDRNPYLELLTGALREQGVDVRLSAIEGLTPLWHAVAQHGRPEVIHLQWQHRFFVPKGGPLRAFCATTLFFVQWLTLRAKGVRFVWTVHNVVNHEAHFGRWEIFANRVLARVVDRMLVHCRTVIPTVAAALKVSESRFVVSPHGTYGDWSGRGGSRSEAREGLGLPEDVRVLLFFGLIRPYKRVETLIRTFQEIRAPDARLVIVGRARTHELAERIRALADRDSRVQAHLEFVDDDRLAAALKAADAVVLPYRDSLTSGAAILAGAAHRPVVMPRLGCVEEFPDDAGIFYDPDEPGGLKAALVRALDADTRALGASAARHVARYRWEDVGAGLVGIYDELACPGSASP